MGERIADSPALHHKVLSPTIELVPGRNDLPGVFGYTWRVRGRTLPRTPEWTRAGARRQGMGLSTAAPPTAAPAAMSEDFSGLLAGCRAKLDRALAAWLDAKREEAAAAGSPETLDLIDGI